MSDFSKLWTVSAIREAKMESRTSDTPNLLPEMMSSPKRNNRIDISLIVCVAHIKKKLANC